VDQDNLHWQHKDELLLVRWAHDAADHQGRDATCIWAHNQEVDLIMDTIVQVIHEYETCTAIKQAKWIKPFWYGE